MKKLIQLSILFALFLFNKTNAQIVITHTNMPAMGDTIRYSNVKTTSINYTVTGTSMFWNYDTLVPINQGMYNYTPASLTPYAYYFFGDYGLKVADSIGAATFKFYNVYDFYKNTTAAFETKGMGFTYTGFPIGANYSTPDQIYVFPLTYPNHDSTLYKVTIAPTSTLSYSQFGYRITDVDGWGIIKTPYDSVPCIRIVSTAYGKDSINYSGFPINIPDVQRSYKWLSLTEKIPVLELSGPYNSGNFVPNVARFRDGVLRSFAGIKQVANNTNKVSVYPNPTNGDLYVYTNSPDATTINLYNLSGVLVAGYKTNDMVTKVSVQNLPKGSYVYRVVSKDGTQEAVGKVIVIN